MRSIGFRILGALLWTSAVQSHNADQRPPGASIQFTRVTSEMRVDGRLDESAWADAASFSHFYEVSPGNVEVPPVETEARFLYDDHNFYVAIRAHDPNPKSIRSALVRRDQVLSDQDYVEILLDPLSSKRSAFMFRANARGVITDGQFDEVLQTRDYSPDLNFDVKPSIDSKGWTVEFRIPLSTLRYQAGANQSWSVVVYRNYPREKTLTLASAPIPRASTCVLCFADRLTGHTLSGHDQPLFLTPQLTYARSVVGDKDTKNRARAGLDAKWTIRPNTSIDATIAPDFSQIEADDLQLTANMRFPLSVIEKRPFFLEGADLLSTPIIAVYTRAFTDPDVGIRVTERNERNEYTALLLRDAGGGTMIEPGPISAQAAPQDFTSTAFVGRYKANLGSVGVGGLATTRWNDDGSQNIVYGLDTNLQLSSSDKITAQVLGSRTREPNRADLLAQWQGQERAGDAGALRWEHSVDAWYSYVSYRNYSLGFRAWNGFETQVGVSSLAAVSSYYFYPRNGFLTRVAPTLTFTNINQSDGDRLSRTVSPGITLRGGHDTELNLTWSPKAQDITPVGLKSYDQYSLSLVTTPAAWMPQATLAVVSGETLDSSTGELGDGLTIQAIVPLRLLSRFELATSFGDQTLNSRRQDVANKRLFNQRYSQLNAIWHFSNYLYAQALYQKSIFTGLAPTTSDDGSAATIVRTQSTLCSLLLSYQLNWQTRYYLGFRQASTDETQREIFAKLSYVFAK